MVSVLEIFVGVTPSSSSLSFSAMSFSLVSVCLFPSGMTQSLRSVVIPTPCRRSFLQKSSYLTKSIDPVFFPQFYTVVLPVTTGVPSSEYSHLHRQSNVSQFLTHPPSFTSKSSINRRLTSLSPFSPLHEIPVVTHLP